MGAFCWFHAGLGAVAAFALSFLLHTVDVDVINAQHKLALEAQVKADTAACDQDKQITKDANDALQKSLTDVNVRLAAAKRMHLSHCVATYSQLADAPTGGDQHAGQDGISSDWLRDYGAECEIYRSEVIELDNFGAAERVK